MNTLNTDQYQLLAGRTVSQLKDQRDNNIHMVLGMLTEAAELADVFKKELAYGKEIDWVNVKEEIGDLMWYIANFCTMNDIRLSNVLHTNIEKLKTRYPKTFTTGEALSRDLDSERKILES